MFIGHDALSFGAKGVTPRMSLGVLIAAPKIAPVNTKITPLDFYDYPWPHWAAQIDRHREARA